MTTLLVSAEELAAAELWIAGDRHRHLCRARRLTAGDRLRLVDGAGAARPARVERLERGRALLTLGRRQQLPRPAPAVELLVAPPRAPRAAWLVEKATELGAAGIRFVASERAPRRYGGATLERLRRIARAALEQSGQAWLPEIGGVHAWAELPELLERCPERRRLAPGAGPWKPLPSGVRAALVIGPEGGWSGAEETDLERLGCVAATVARSILRIETAAVAAAALAAAGGCDELR